MGNCCSTGQRPMTPRGFPSEFQPIQQFLHLKNEDQMILQLEPTIEYMLRANDENFGKFMDCLNSIYSNSATDPQMNFFILLLIENLIGRRPGFEVSMISPKVADLFVRLKPIALQQSDIQRYSPSQEYNYWTRTVCLNLELIQQMSEHPLNTKPDNPFKLFKNKFPHLFPRNSSYRNVSAKLKAIILTDSTQRIETIKHIRIAACEEVIETIQSGGNHLSKGSIAIELEKEVAQLSESILFKTDKDILKILNLDHLQVLAQNEQGFTKELTSLYTQAASNSLPALSFLQNLRSISESRFPDSKNLFTDFNLGFKLPPMMTETAAFPEVSPLSQPQSHPYHQFHPENQSHTQPHLRSQTFNEIKLNYSDDRIDLNPDVHITRSKSANINNSERDRSRSPQPNLLPHSQSRHEFSMSPTPSRQVEKAFSAPTAKEAEKIYALKEENEELETLIVALEEERKICEQSFLETSRAHQSASMVSNYSRKTKIGPFQKASGNALELQRILREKDSMIQELEEKLEKLEKEYEASFNEDYVDFSKADILEEPRLFTEQTFSKMFAVNETIPQKNYNKKNEFLDELEGSKFIQDLYSNIDKSLHKRTGL